MTMTTKELDIATLDHGDIEFRVSPWPIVYQNTLMDLVVVKHL
jgi:hypothetical protein